MPLSARAPGPDRSLVRARNRIDAELARTVRRADLTQAAEHDGLKSMRSWLRGHARLSDARPSSWSAAAGRWSTCRRWRRRSPTGRSPPSRSTRRAGHHAGAAGAGRRAGRRPGRGRRVLAVLATEVPTASCGRPSAPTPALDPDGTEPDPTEGRSLSMSQHSAAAFSGGSPLDAVGGEKVATALESIAAADPAAPGTPHPRPASAATRSSSWRRRLASGQLPILRTVKPHVGVMIGIDDLVDPATGPGAAPPAWARRSPPPGPAGWPATATSPASSSARTRSPGPGPQPAGRRRPTCAGPSSCATDCVFAGCEAPALVRRPPRPALGRRRRDLPGELSAAVRTPPHARSTTASGSSEIPTADGTPTAPTAPRSFLAPAAL